MTKIQSFSTAGTSDVIQVSNLDEEEKKSEMSVNELENNEEVPAEPKTVNEIFKQRLLESKK